jgi:hypothetical protein
MVRIEDSRGKLGESFARIFGNPDMAILFSKIQSAVIRSGFELEKMIEGAIPDHMKTTLDSLGVVTRDEVKAPPVQVVIKPTRPDPENPRKSIEADLLIVDNTSRLFTLVEVKDGYVFDTKKADGELASLKKITSWLAQAFPYRAEYFLCSFTQENKEAIVQGAKQRFSLERVLTGRELCERININYDELCEARKLDQAANRQYFLTELLKIPQVREEVLTLLSESDPGWE